MKLRFVPLVLLAGCACTTTPTPIPGVVETPPGGTIKSLPGPMPNFGPFESYSDALIAACPLILGKPHAVAGRPSDPNFELYLQLSTEYCAWLYYTPAGKFEMTMLTASAAQADPSRRQCQLPSWVDDPRYPSDSLGYVFVLHTHAYMKRIMDLDVSAIVELGRAHGFNVRVNGRDIPLSIIAFYSNSTHDNPTCDGFFQYIPLTEEILQWTRDPHGGWTRRQVAAVKWTSPIKFTIVDM